MANPLKKLFVENQNSINLILNFLLVGVISFLSWQLENRVFSIFIITFFFVAMFFRRKHYFVLISVSIILFVLFNTLTLDALILLKKSDLPSIQHPKAELINLFTPHSGQGVLPPQVITMISILNENGVESYKLSEKYSADVVIYQRIVEGAWPIRPDNNSSFTLIATDEMDNYKDCLTIDKKEDVVLVNCS